MEQLEAELDRYLDGRFAAIVYPSSDPRGVSMHRNTRTIK
jgi:hypothetical protein